MWITHPQLLRLLWLAAICVAGGAAIPLVTGATNALMQVLQLALQSPLHFVHAIPHVLRVRQSARHPSWTMLRRHGLARAQIPARAGRRRRQHLDAAHERAVVVPELSVNGDHGR